MKKGRPSESADEVQVVPMDAMETSRRRSAEGAGHETDDVGRGGVGSMTDDSMQEAWRDTDCPELML